MSKTRVLIVSDQPLTVLGLREILRSEQSVQVIGEIRSSAVVPGIISQLRADMVVVDCHLAGLPAENLITEIKKQVPSAAILVLIPALNEVLISSILAAGASGCLLKTERVEAILEALQATARGEIRLGHYIAEILSKLVSREKTYTPNLTNREREVLQLMCTGKSNADIAALLGIELGTVKSHTVNIYNKLGVNSRVEAVIWALELEHWDL